MYEKAYSIPLKGSISAKSNNLSILAQDSMNSYAVVGSYALHLTIMKGNNSFKELSIRVTSEDKKIPLNLIDAKFCIFKERAILVALSNKNIFFYNEDGSSLIYSYLLKDDTANPCAVISLNQNMVVVGTSVGSLLFFEVPSKGDKISLLTEIKEKSIQGSVTCLATDKKDSIICVGDSAGNCIIFDCQEIQNLKIANISRFSLSQNSVTCICMWKDFVITSYSHGVISIYDINQDCHLLDIHAHARYINSLDVCKDLLVSSGEDCFFRVWQLNEINKMIKVNHLHSGLVADTLISSARFNNNTNQICISGYDNMEIFVYESK